MGCSALGGVHMDSILEDFLPLSPYPVFEPFQKLND